MVAVTSCRRGSASGLRRRWAEFPLVRARDGKADKPDKRPPEGKYTPGLFDSESSPERKAA